MPARLAIALFSSIQSCSELRPGCRATKVWLVASISISLTVSFQLPYCSAWFLILIVRFVTLET